MFQYMLLNRSTLFLITYSKNKPILKCLSILTLFLAPVDEDGKNSSAIVPLC